MRIEDAKAKYPDAISFKFGDTRELCNKLLTLVRTERKTATCGALRDYQSGAEMLPKIGQCDIALDWDGNPALIIQTTEVTIKRFCDVEQDFALAEGENVDFAGWKADHRAYFERNGGFDPEMELVCERFRLVEDFG